MKISQKIAPKRRIVNKKFLVQNTFNSFLLKKYHIMFKFKNLLTYNLKQKSGYFPGKQNLDPPGPPPSKMYKKKFSLMVKKINLHKFT